MSTHKPETQQEAPTAEQVRGVIAGLELASYALRPSSLGAAVEDGIQLILKMCALALPGQSIEFVDEGENQRPMGDSRPESERFCDAHCVWTNHHPDCPIGGESPTIAENSATASAVPDDCLGTQDDRDLLRLNPILANSYLWVPIQPTEEMIEKAARDGVDGNFDDFSNGVKDLSRKFAARSYTVFLANSPVAQKVPGFKAALLKQLRTYGVSGTALTDEQSSVIATCCDEANASLAPTFGSAKVT